LPHPLRAGCRRNLQGSADRVTIWQG
jgi:hypothetical protein